LLIQTARSENGPENLEGEILVDLKRLISQKYLNFRFRAAIFSSGIWQIFLRALFSVTI
jgi:hypothetical protein